MKFDKKDVYVVIILLLVSLLFFYQLILRPTEIVAGGDNIHFSAAFNYFNYHSIKDYKQFPLWNPYTFSGLPFISNVLIGRYYPTNILFWFFL